MKEDIRGHENRSYLELLLANAKKEQDERDKESKWYEEPKASDYGFGNQYRQSMKHRQEDAGICQFFGVYSERRIRIRFHQNKVRDRKVKTQSRRERIHPEKFLRHRAMI